MHEVASPDALRESLEGLPRPISIVPLTFDLHEGHLTLVRRARIESSSVVVSMFDSIRFGPKGLFARYPSSPELDRALLRSLGVDLLFAAGDFPMLNNGMVDIHDSIQCCESDRHPLHFQNVANFMGWLFSIAQPCRAYLGEKDFEQIQLVRRLATRFCPQLTIIACPTVREADGLALSSTNKHLCENDRSRANALYLGLRAAQELLSHGCHDSAALQSAILTGLDLHGLVPDYAVVVDAATLAPVDCVGEPARALAAAYLGLVRLVDNVPLIP
jgi:pantoate--beta-alanine ligase